MWKMTCRYGKEPVSHQKQGLLRLNLHLRFLILLLVPALAVPRGVILDWCLCFDAELECCNSCCDDDGEATTKFSDCDGCKSIEVDDFQEALCPAPVEVPSPVLALAPPSVSLPMGEWFADEDVEARAPPEALIPPGLRPGTRPLRL